MDLVEIYCWKCPHYWGDSLCEFGYADPTEDWCELTAGEIDPDLLEWDFESELEPSSNEKKATKFPRRVEMPSKRWLLDLHKRSKEPLEFPEILDEYSSFIGRKLRSSEKYNLAFSLQELIEEGKLQFKEGRTQLG